MSRREVIEIGSAPYGERCAELGEADYDDRAYAECNALIEQLEREAAAAGVDLAGVHLFRKSNPHDYGTYYEVAVRFDDGVETQVRAAYWLEANAPEEWDAEARAELGLEVAS